MAYHGRGERFGLGAWTIFLIGLLVGVILGWLFQGVIVLLIRIALIVVVVAATLYLYRRWREHRYPPPRTYDDIPEADWRDLGPRRPRR